MLIIKLSQALKELRHVLSRCELPPRTRRKIEKIVGDLEDAVAAQAKPSLLRQHKGTLVAIAFIVIEVWVRMLSTAVG